MSGSDVRDFIEGADGFAEVFPEHKYQVSIQKKISSAIYRIICSSISKGCIDASRTRSPDCDDGRCAYCSDPFLHPLNISFNYRASVSTGKHRCAD